MIIFCPTASRSRSGFAVVSRRNILTESTTVLFGGLKDGFLIYIQI